MILIDIGNTNIVFAVSNNNKIKKISRIDTNVETIMFVKNVNKIIKNFLDKKFLKNSKFAVISSVVPNINTHLIKILKNLLLFMKYGLILMKLKIYENLMKIGNNKIQIMNI